MQLEPVNISLGGVKFYSNRCMSIFAVIQMSLLDKYIKKSPLTLKGKIVRVEKIDVGLQEKNYGVAVEFLDVPDIVHKEMAFHLQPKSTSHLR